MSDGEHQVDDYIHGLLKAALTRSLGPDESLDLVVSDVINTQNRTITELMKGRQLDLMWTMTTQDRELKMRPVRVPIFRGMLGYRVLLIKQGKQSTFDAVNTLAQLAPLKAGQDPQWPDTTILASAGLRVVSGPYTQLFTMLRNDRIDYFPRGMNEVLPELAAEQGLALENHLLLAYPAPMYFFVRKANEDLARRLEVGLASMVQDGSYEDYFNNHPLIVNTLNALNVAKRRIIALPNPLLPAETPLSDPRLWLFPPAN
ncbi:hypothetical protein [Simiduia agarivorans]|uniref:hypothetical protein n=1 Tax=Simiduia agarivorans TaxID=447471 RepID=UPI0005AB5017|nr:hypothetical protein [Simiduia agarivorans]